MYHLHITTHSYCSVHVYVCVCVCVCAKSGSRNSKYHWKFMISVKTDVYMSHWSLVARPFLCRVGITVDMISACSRCSNFTREMCLKQFTESTSPGTDTVNISTEIVVAHLISLLLNQSKLRAYKNLGKIHSLPSHGLLGSGHGRLLVLVILQYENDILVIIWLLFWQPEHLSM